MSFGFQFLALGIGIAIPSYGLRLTNPGNTYLILYIPAAILTSFAIYIVFRKTQFIALISQLFEKSYASQLATLFTGALLLGTLTAVLLFWIKSFTY